MTIEKKSLKVEVKVNSKKLEQFQRVLEGLIASGFDNIYLTEGQSKIWIYLREPDGVNLCVNLDGTWDIE